MTTQQLQLNAAMPEFTKLPGVDGKSHSSPEYAKIPVLIVVFSCNHCPYVQAYEERMIALQRDYASKGARLVAINSNDIVNYPDDSFERMKERAAEKKFNFDYLRDDDQSVAEKYGATHTPQFFVFDASRKLRYVGKLDDNWQNPSAVKERYVRDAVDALLAGQDVKVPETYSIGCTIKWR